MVSLTENSSLPRTKNDPIPSICHQHSPKAAQTDKPSNVLLHPQASLSRWSSTKNGSHLNFSWIDALSPSPGPEHCVCYLPALQTEEQQGIEKRAGTNLPVRNNHELSMYTQILILLPQDGQMLPSSVMVLGLL